jgi:hypothetical protein
MYCPECSNSELKTYDTRKVDGENAVTRKRQCLACLHKFKTIETIATYVAIERRPPAPKAVPKPPRIEVAKAKIKKRVDAMRTIQERREQRSFEPWSPDNDYLDHL